MYSIFFNNRCIHICEKGSSALSLPDVHIYQPKIDEPWEDLPVSFECMLHVKHLVIPVEDPEGCFMRVCGAFDVMPAAGGLVQNDQGDLLMIYRFDRWDLPKGKQEEGETSQETALREVAEETGVQGLVFLSPLPCAKTYHAYRYEGVLTLKETTWFRFITSSNAPLVPQTEEGIERVAWITPSALEACLSTTYASIRQIFVDFPR